MSAAVQEVDPRDVLVDRNIGAVRRPDPDLVESVRELGLLTPPVVEQTSDGRLRCVDGHRRIGAAIEAGISPITVVVAGAEDDGDRGKVARVLGQHAVNTHRAGLSAGDQAAAVAQLLDLGLSAADVAKRARVPRDKVAAARAVASSSAATTAAASYDLDLDQLAGVAEFDQAGDDAAVQALTAAAAEGKFNHELRRRRDERDTAAGRAAKIAELEAAGVKVLDTMPGDKFRLYNWRTTKNKALTDANHAKCPGRAVMVTAYMTHPWQTGKQESVVSVQLHEFCLEPKASGHVAYSQGAGGATDQTTEERRRIRAGNADWRAARAVRQAWIADLCKRKTPPPGALRYILQAIAGGDNRLRVGMEKGHRTGRALIGVPPPDPKPDYGGWPCDLVAEQVGAVGEQRAVVLALGQVLGAQDEMTGDRAWDQPWDGDVAFLRGLESFGYPLADVERQAIATWEATQEKIAAANAADAADVAARDAAGAAADGGGGDDE